MIKPLGKYVLLEELPAPDRSPGGVMIPESVLQTQFYRVIAWGRKVKFPIREGDKVCLDQYNLSQKDGAGKGLWLVPDHSLAFVLGV